ncbi:DUF2892 domain-containing protein [Marivirga salinae]|uniref:DUF2892 domain-containing protein n=1 Tax=Marivirga salinarum TaxID=3059078 RepID=A0AA51NA46_9BACT|nr:DUF2892 domain-containing protein [Marivirga sp. BDSF4-3]WMN11368.1 DUF2892 domain-containing protein [Marivirga sp. BDSF4-3]
MQANRRTADKTIIILLAIIVGVFYYFGIILETLAIILGNLALVIVFSSIISF